MRKGVCLFAHGENEAMSKCIQGSWVGLRHTITARHMLVIVAVQVIASWKSMPCSVGLLFERCSSFASPSNLRLARASCKAFTHLYMCVCVCMCACVCACVHVRVREQLVALTVIAWICHRWSC